MKVYCGAYRIPFGTSAIIYDTDIDSYYCYGGVALGFMRLSGLGVEDPVELGIPAWYVFEYSKEVDKLSDDAVAVLWGKREVRAFTTKELKVETVDEVPPTTLVQELIAANPGIDEVVLRTLLYRFLISRKFTSYAARFVACSGTSPGFQLSKERTEALARAAWGSTSDTIAYLETFLDKHEWELSRPSEDLRLRMVATKKDGECQVVQGYSRQKPLPKPPSHDDPEYAMYAEDDCMYDGYVAITYFDSDTAESAWARASRSNDYCVHASLSRLLLKICSLPGQDLIGICKVCCTHPIDEVHYAPVTDIHDIVYIGRPSEILST